MKKMLLMILTLGALLPARAQFLSPEAVGGAFWGTLIGGIAGSDCRRGFSGNGAAIGAGVGLLAGALVGESRRNYYDGSTTYAYSTPPTVTFGYGYGSCGNGGYVYYSPNRYCAPNYYYRSRPNYAVGGTLLGAASGALIGAGSGDAGPGAAIGAAAGLVVGTVAEASARHHERRNAVAAQPTAVVETPVPMTRSTMPPATITSRPVANSTYYWTTPPQIADAPRVPDAPTF
jgi:uncharacterized protein YcfJ